MSNILKQSILIVDDRPENLFALESLLESPEREIIKANSGDEALGVVLEHDFSLILLDVQMPGMDGFEAAALIRGVERTRSIPIIFVTAISKEQQHIFKGYEVGAVDYLFKPIDPVILESKVKIFLELDRKKRDLKEALESVEEKNKSLEKAYGDLKSAQSQLLQQEKMASIGQLAAGIAHEINNPTGFIKSNLSTFSRYCEKMIAFISLLTESIEELQAGSNAAGSISDNVKERRVALKIDHIINDLPCLIQESIEGADRVKNIVQNLKSFSRIDEAEHKAADINAAIENTLTIVGSELKYNATVKKEYGEIPQTVCRPGALNQVFLNILVNAAHAIESKGVITIKTWLENLFIYVAISDTGCGIPEDIRDKIFEPFFTTKEVGKGTGLGLSIVYDIIKKNDCEIFVDSEVGKGSTFTIKIPVIDA